MKRFWKNGAVLSVISSFFGSVSAVLAVGATRFLNPIAVAGFAAFIAGAVLFAATMMSKKRKITWQILKDNKKDIAVQSLIRGFIAHGVLLVGYSMTTAIKAVFFTKIEPFFVLMWGHLMGKEKLHARHIFIIVIHLSGVLLLSTGGNLSGFGTTQIGDGLIILAVLLLGYTYYSGARLAKKIGARASVAITNLIGGGLNISLAFIIAPISAMVSFQGWMYLLGYLTFFHIIALTLWYAALKTARGWVVSAVRALGPVMGAVAAFILFGEVLTGAQLMGAGVILVTSVLIAKER